MTDPVAGSAPGSDASIELADGRRLEYWVGGDPDGRPVIFHPGTPVTRLLGRWGHAAAVAAGVRLVAVNRPGYGGSTTPDGVPSLAGVGRDTVELAARLGLDEFAVFGSSGGAPFAMATAIAAPDRVRAFGSVGGVGPWRLLNDSAGDMEDRECLAMLDAGNAAGTWDCFYRQVEDRRAQVSPQQAADDLLARESSAMTANADYRAIWVENWRLVQANLDGYVYDNVAWGGAWDIDSRDVVAPTLLFYGTNDVHCPPDTHGRWYADRITGSELVVVPSEGHFEVIDGFWPEVLAGLLRTWGPPRRASEAAT